MLIRVHRLRDVENINVDMEVEAPVADDMEVDSDKAAAGRVASQKGDLPHKAHKRIIRLI